MTVELTVDKQDRIKVGIASPNGRFFIKLGDVEIFLDRQDLEELENAIEAELWDEEYYRKNLEEKLEEALTKAEKIEEKIWQIEEGYDYEAV